MFWLSTYILTQVSQSFVVMIWADGVPIKQQRQRKIILTTTFIDTTLHRNHLYHNQLLFISKKSFFCFMVFNGQRSWCQGQSQAQTPKLKKSGTFIVSVKRWTHLCNMKYIPTSNEYLAAPQRSYKQRSPSKRQEHLPVPIWKWLLCNGLKMVNDKS